MVKGYAAPLKCPIWNGESTCTSGRDKKAELHDHSIMLNESLATAFHSSISESLATVATWGDEQRCKHYSENGMYFNGR